MGDNANQILGIFYDGGSYPVLEAWSQGGATPLSSVIRKLAALTNFQRNPRSMEYMEMLLRANWPGRIRLVQIKTDRRVPALNLADYSRVVLLWPDSNGMGWRKIERQLSGIQHGSIVVLNGRNRTFEFYGPTFRKLRMRRLIEKSHVDKIIFCVALAILTPSIWFVDFLRGRR
jgi:hypothetical protein